MGRIRLGNRLLFDPRASLKEGALLNFEDKVKRASHGIKILYEDKDLVVIEKPAGLLSVATDFEERETVHHALKGRFYRQQVFPVHRLDRETSGVMVLAYTREARAGLKKQFFHHSIKRQYLALVEGEVQEKKGKWESLLKEDANYFVSSHPEGKQAITYFEVVKIKRGCTALKLRLETGRKNQIRAQASEAGFPIVGDTKYGARGSPIKRLGLHAHFLSFMHPVRKKIMEFKSSHPSSFNVYFGQIK